MPGFEQKADGGTKVFKPRSLDMRQTLSIGPLLDLEGEPKEEEAGELETDYEEKLVLGKEVERILRMFQLATFHAAIFPVNAEQNKEDVVLLEI